MFRIFCFLFCTLYGETLLDPQNYLAQVERNNQNISSYEEQENSYFTQSIRGSLNFVPFFKTSAQAIVTQQPQLVPYFPIFLNHANLINQTYKASVEQKTDFGLEWELGTSSNFFKLITHPSNLNNILLNVSLDLPIETFISKTVSELGSLIPPISTWSSTQGLALKQHLWKNGFGKSDRAKARQVEHHFRSLAYQERYKLQKALIDAEKNYWQLTIARALVNIRKEILDESNILLSYIERKKGNFIASEAEMLQARSIAMYAQVEYKKAVENETAVALSFNSLRGISSSSVEEQLLALTPEMISSYAPKFKGERNDLLAQREEIESEKEQNIIDVNDLLPECNIKGFVGAQGNASDLGRSLNNSVTHPSWQGSILFELVIPLSPVKIRSVIRSYKRSSFSLDQNLRRMEFEHNQEWDRLQVSLKDNEKMLKILFDYGRIQRDRYENQKVDFERGLTSFFNVTSAAADYQNTKIELLDVFQKITNIILDMRLYETR